jgi:hypothetical protein
MIKSTMSLNNYIIHKGKVIKKEKLLKKLEKKTNIHKFKDILNCVEKVFESMNQIEAILDSLNPKEYGTNQSNKCMKEIQYKLLEIISHSNNLIDGLNNGIPSAPPSSSFQSQNTQNIQPNISSPYPHFINQELYPEINPGINVNKLFKQF